MTVRAPIRDFTLSNPLYKNASVSWYTVAAGVKTSTLATLYAGPSGATQVANPTKLNSQGQFKQAVYIADQVIGVITGISVPGHDTGIHSPFPTFRVLDEPNPTLDYTYDGGVTYAEAGPITSSGAGLVGFLQAGTGAVARTAQAKMRESVSVNDFGAVGDGVADDTAAINLATETGASEVTVPDGTYFITGSILLASNQTFRVSDNATITAVAATMGQNPMLTNADSVGGNTNVSVVGGRLARTEDAATDVWPQILFDNVTNGKIENVTVVNTGDPSYISIPYEPGIITFYNSTNCEAVDCSVTDALSSGGFLAIDSSRCSFIRCKAVNCKNAGITTVTSPTTLIADCYVENSEGSHIACNSQYSTVRNNRVVAGVDSATAPGINVGEDSAAASASYSVISGNIITGTLNANSIQVQQTHTDFVTVSNNYCAGTGLKSGIKLDGTNCVAAGNMCTAHLKGIEIYGPHMTVTGNRCVANESHGIYSSPGDYNVITGNTCLNNGQGAASYGIYVPSGSTNNSISGNVCTDNQSPKTQAYGIVVESTPNIVGPNVISGNLSGNSSTNQEGNVIQQQLADATGIQNTKTADFDAVDNSATGTPSVLNMRVGRITSTTTITGLTGGYKGQIVTLIADATVTITDGTNIFLSGSANWTMAATDTLTLLRRTGSGANDKWYEIARSDNT